LCWQNKVKHVGLYLFITADVNVAALVYIKLHLRFTVVCHMSEIRKLKALVYKPYVRDDGDDGEQ